MSTTLRYFPALKEEFVHINAAMKLQNISWASRLECTVVPLIVSAVYTWQRSFSAWTMFEATTNLPKHTAAYAMNN